MKMSKTEANSPVDLSVMLGILGGNDFMVGDKKYVVKPMKLKEVNEFMKDNLGLSTQLFAISNEASKKKMDKWLSNHCFDKIGEPMTVEKAINDDWSIVDLREFIKRLCDLSG
jgi:hypothetical protein